MNPEVKEELQRRCTKGSRFPMNSLRMKVGIGSNSHDLDGDNLMTFSNISMEHGRRLEKLCGTSFIRGFCAPEVSDQTFSTFASKKSRKFPGRMKVQSQRTSHRDPTGMTCFATASSDSWSCLRFCLPRTGIPSP